MVRIIKVIEYAQNGFVLNGFLVVSDIASPSLSGFISNNGAIGCMSLLI